MKTRRVAALLLVLILAFSAIGVVAAEKSGDGSSLDEAVILTTEDMESGVFDEQWYNTGTGLDVCLPADWEMQEVTEEAAAKGLAFLTGQPGGGANITMTSVDKPKGDSLENEYAALAQNPDQYSSIAFAKINDVPCVVFDDQVNLTTGFITILNDKVICAIIAPPSNDEYEAFKPSARNILCSFSYTEEAE